VRKPDRESVIGALWGFAEATLFFMVPDVWLGWIALTSLKRALIATLAALVGAVAGGLLVAGVCAYVEPATSFRAMDTVPAVSPAMIRDVDADVAERGSRAIVDGPVRGIPYKLYARAEGIQGGPDVAFVFWSILGRAYRWVILIPLIWLVSHLARKWLHFTDRQARGVYIVGWCLFYAWYLTTVAWS